MLDRLASSNFVKLPQNSFVELPQNSFVKLRRISSKKKQPRQTSSNFLKQLRQTSSNFVKPARAELERHVGHFFFNSINSFVAYRRWRSSFPRRAHEIPTIVSQTE
ncbi:hypothetical protein QLX08_011404 [Tetragonisca angustula]|uniref:Uncharacterized protein n=1 Tax=Tetragonisca angustula TaxID=166442 RepID=A0AAW0Z8P9_9HYME